MTEKRPQNSLYRIIDAAANRTSEGLRVVEDLVRWQHQDPHLAKQLKTLRHELRQLVHGLIGDAGWRMRDAQGDVGRRIEVPTEYQRQDSDDSGSPGDSLVLANLKRATEGLRSIEEMAKVLDGAAARTAESLRYDVYTLERAVLTSLTAAAIPAPAVYVLVDAGDWPECCGPEQVHVEPSRIASSQLAQDVEQLVAAEVDFIQLRDKQLSDRQLLAAARWIASRLRGTSTRLVINDRVDLALACGASVLHLGQEDLPVAAARQLVGPEVLLGVSTHSVQQARQAVLDGADYIAVGPVFPSRTKSFAEHVGTELVRQVTAEVGLPVFAIGGIDRDNVAQIAAAGCSRIAVSGAFDRPAGRHTWGDVAAQFRQALASAAPAVNPESA